MENEKEVGLRKFIQDAILEAEMQTRNYGGTHCTEEWDVLVDSIMERIESHGQSCYEKGIAESKLEIFKLEKLVEERSVNTGWGKSCELQSELTTLKAKVEKLVSALEIIENFASNKVASWMSPEIASRASEALKTWNGEK